MNSPKRPVLRAVVDTNILLRVLLKPSGPSARLFDAAQAGRFQLLVSPFILRELRLGFLKPRIRRGYALSYEEIAQYVTSVQAAAEVVPGQLQVHYGSKDPDDNPVLACAIEANADVLVTDDRRDLLPLKHYHGVRIVSLPDFLRSLP